MFPDTLITSAHSLWTQMHTYKPSVITGSVMSTYSLSLWRDHINGTHNTGLDTWSNCSCLSLNVLCRMCCSVCWHASASIVMLSQWLSAYRAMQCWKQSPVFSRSVWVKCITAQQKSDCDCNGVFMEPLHALMCIMVAAGSLYGKKKKHVEISYFKQ